MAQRQPVNTGTFTAMVVKGEQGFVEKGQPYPICTGKIVYHANRQKHQSLVANAYYWSSTEYNATYAFFNNGNTNNNNKTNTYIAHAVRAF